MRWLLVKDLQILRRSPLLVTLLIVYPVAVALMIGFALSSPPAKPAVAIANEIPAGKGVIDLGASKLDVSSYTNRLVQSISPIRVRSEAEAIARVREGRALAAIVIPASLPGQIQSLITQGIGHPAVKLYLNNRDPLDRQFVDQAIAARVANVQSAVSRQVLQVAVQDLQQVLNGGRIDILGESVQLLGLRNSRTIIDGALATLPRNSALRPALRQVVGFATLAIEGLGFAKPILGSIGNPLTVQETRLAGKTTPTDAYAAAIAVVVSLMFVAMLLAAGMLALERSENAYARLVRGLVTPGGLLGEKVVLSGACAAAGTFLMAVFVSLFVHLDWGRVGLWVAALAVAGIAFGALGVAIGALAREVSAASLMAFLVALPIAFAALVPSRSVSGTLAAVLKVVAFCFPFRAGLDAVSNAFSGSSPAIGLPLVHLAVLALVFGALARLGMRRFAAAR